VTAVTALEANVETKHVPAGKSPVRSRFRPRRLYALALQVAIVTIFLVLWEVSSRNGWVDPLIAGSPSGTWTAFWEYLSDPMAWESMKATGTAVLLAFVIGTVLGTIFGLALGLFPFLGTVLGPFMGPINSIPRIALAPLFIAWFGLTTTSKVVLGVSVVFFILAENARGAVRSVDQDILTLSKVMGIRGRALVWKIVLPSVVPTMFAGVRLAYTYALLGVVASEMIAAASGVGQDIVRYSTSFQINTVFAILLIIMIVTVAVNALFSAVERRLLIWQEA
jgi:NitT/TauT family transport system permease protein